MAETLGDAFPVIQLEGGPIELLKLAAWDIGITGATHTSPVGQTVGFQLFNPAGSGKLVIPTSAWFSLNATSVLFFGVTTVALATASVGRQRDTREGVLARTVAIGRSGNAPVPPVGAGQILTENNIPLKFDDSDGLAVLAPGTGFTFVTVSTNVAVRFGFFYRERTAEPSELNF